MHINQVSYRLERCIITKPKFEEQAGPSGVRDSGERHDISSRRHTIYNLPAAQQQYPALPGTGIVHLRSAYFKTDQYPAPSENQIVTCNHLMGLSLVRSIILRLALSLLRYSTSLFIDSQAQQFLASSSRAQAQIALQEGSQFSSDPPESYVGLP